MGRKKNHYHQQQQQQQGKRKRNNNYHHEYDHKSTKKSLTIGPIKVTNEDDIGIKTFTFCRKYITSLSIRELRTCFLNKEVFIIRYLDNGQQIENHVNETYRVQQQDEVQIRRDEMQLKKSRIESIPIHIEFFNDHFVVVYKPAGLSIAKSHCNDSSSVYEEGVVDKITSWKKSNLCDDNCSPDKDHVGYLLYRLDKTIEGLCVMSRNKLDDINMLTMMKTNHLRVKFTCIVVGYHGDAGKMHEVRSEHDQANMSLMVEVLSVTSSRSADDQCLSLLLVTIILSSTSTELPTISSTATEIDQHHDDLTCVVRNVVKCLSDNKMFIIGGENGLVKKDKSHYIALTHITFTDVMAFKQQYNVESFLDYVNQGNVSSSYTSKSSEDNTDNFEIIMKTPKRFLKLLEIEEQLYKESNLRDKELLRQHLIMLYHDDNIIGEELRAKHQLLDEGLPVEYILEKALFCGYEFYVNENVMIPRKSSETIVHEVVQQVSQMIHNHSSSESGRVFNLLDIGVGSGCLLISSLLLLHEKFPHVIFRGIGMDICDKALTVARDNAASLTSSLSNVTVEFIQHDLKSIDTVVKVLKQLGSDQPNDQQRHDVSDEGPHQNINNINYFDIIMCNPPYSHPHQDAARLSSSRKVHEPAIALYSGGECATSCYDDLALALSRALQQNVIDSSLKHGSVNDCTEGIFINSILDNQAFNGGNDGPMRAADINDNYLNSNEQEFGEYIDKSLLSHGGKVVIEIGHGQHQEVSQIFKTKCKLLKCIKIVDDHNGVKRCIMFEKSTKC